MRWEIRLAATAKRQIAAALARSLEDFGARKRDEYRELVRSALEEIATDPTGPHSLSRPELASDARTFHIGRRGRRARHLFVYRIEPSGKIDVSRFLYDTMAIVEHVPKRFRAGE